ncbi:TLD-domain-containing protein [Rhizophagus diaphanus]|nr:TLD-domain-containing protein [Rhizophagus diaphanus] [Rhizophagus sp. MUCL 43196]
MAFDYSQELMNDYENYLKSIKDMMSQYFRAAFSNEWANKKDGNFILNKPNISPQILTIILRFIYCGRINLTELQEEFLLKVYPFNALLPEDIINNLLTFHTNSNKELDIKILPPRSPNYDSIIIKSKHFAHFSSWVKKKNNFFYNESNNPYDFNLLFRASRDGKTPADFHAKCDNKGATIVILKIPNSEQILGGYNPINWNSNCQWMYTSDSFIFSFTNKNNFRTAEVGYIKKTDYDCAIHCHQNYGPAFGEGYDLYQDNDGNWKSFNSCSYYKIDIPLGNEIMGGYNAFNVEDYEVFQVVNK